MNHIAISLNRITTLSRHSRLNNSWGENVGIHTQFEDIPFFSV